MLSKAKRLAFDTKEKVPKICNSERKKNVMEDTSLEFKILHQNFKYNHRVAKDQVGNHLYCVSLTTTIIFIQDQQKS